MSQFAQTMSANAEQTRFQADGVTSASAAEQLSASINEISRQVSQSSQASQTASQEAARTNQTM
jgi:methyl-accepting chemotaxis protein